MHELVMRIREPEKCYIFADNARRRGHDDLALQAFRRAVELKAAAHEAETEAELMALQAFYAYEEALSFGERKRKRATGTWQMVNRIGVLPTLHKRLQSRTPDEVSERLKTLGMEDLSFEAVARAYPEVASEAA